MFKKHYQHVDNEFKSFPAAVATYFHPNLHINLFSVHAKFNPNSSIMIVNVFTNDTSNAILIEM